RHGPVQRRRFPQVTLILACAWTGALDEGRVVLGALGASVVGIGKPNELMAEGWLQAMDGHPATALQLMQDAVDAALAVGAFGAACRALHTLTRLGHPELAVDQIDEIAADLQGDFHAARVAHVRAAAGRDAAALTRAAESFAAVGAELLAAEAFADAARTLRRDGSPRDASRAIGRSRALAARCEGAATPALLLGDTPVALTTREREIAVLAARGLASKQIAARLDISPRTVDNHLQRVYDKLGITTRFQLATTLEGS
ncbi:MAG TPA: helix-turn-helix transcriptional regulator, partial [Ilumatobacteraceae bacterium]|nr:helix-turn-helix transcriptional regulator [Ilumatobacteraceae bacterium]